MEFGNKKKALIKVGYKCNNSCKFCWVEAYGRKGHDSTTQEIFEKIKIAKQIGAEMVVLSGGEPTIRNDLFKILSFIKKQGMSLGLGTNGRMFSSDRFFNKIKKYNLEYVQVSFHSYDKLVHNEVTKTSSGFEQTTAGIKKLIGAGIPVIVNIVVTSNNLKDLNMTLDCLKSLGVICVRMSVIEPMSDSTLVPSLKEVIIKVNEAMHYGLNLKMNVYYSALPRCKMVFSDRYCDLYEMGFKWLSESFESKFFCIDTPDKFNRLDLCKGCANKECFGIYKRYFNFMSDEDREFIRDH